MRRQDYHMYIRLSSTFLSQRSLLDGAIWEKVFLMVLLGNSSPSSGRKDI